jgi:hypothetical protein
MAKSIPGFKGQVACLVLCLTCMEMELLLFKRDAFMIG